MTPHFRCANDIPTGTLLLNGIYILYYILQYFYAIDYGVCGLNRTNRNTLTSTKKQREEYEKYGAIKVATLAFMQKAEMFNENKEFCPTEMSKKVSCS